MKKGGFSAIALGLLALLFLAGIASASSIPVYVKPLSSDGSLNPNAAYSYVFDWTTDSSCSNVIFSNSTVIVTGNDGVGFVNLVIPSDLASAPSYMCEYRNGTLRAVHSLASQFSDKVFAGAIYENGNLLSDAYYPKSNPYSFYNSTTIPNYITWANAMNNTLATWAQVMNGTVTGGKITWANAVNGTLALASSLSGYYPLNNPYGYYNSTSFDISNYYLKSNPYGYYNSTNPPPSSGVSWANVVNGTLMPQATFNTNYSTNDAAYRDITNTSYYLSSNPSGFITNSTMNKTVSCTNIIGGSDADFCADAVGETGSGITWSEAVNGTLLSASAFNINYSANDAAYRDITNTSYYLATNPFGFYNSTTLPASNEALWNANYSTYLTHITWAKAVNGTLILASDEGNLNVNSADYIDSYDSSYFMPLNTSVIGNFDFNGGWSSGGVSIEGGGIYAQTIYVYNISSLNVVEQNLSIINDLRAYGTLTSDSLKTASCDVKAYDSNGTLYCGTDAVGEAGSGISWAEAVNGTLMPQATFNTNYSTNDAAYRSITNTSYYLATNPFGFYNSTSFNINDYYPLSNPYGYYNSTNPPPSSGVDWADVVNGTVYLSSNPSGYIDWSKAINGTLYLASNPSGYISSESLWNANYSTYLTKPTWANVMNGTVTSGLISWSNAVNGTLMSQATFNTNYSTNDAAYRDITNTSYYLATNPFGFYNSTNPSPETKWNANYSTYLTHIDWSKAVNGTLLPTATFNSNYSATDAIYSSFAANYSTYLTHIDWSKAVNGTLLPTATFNSNYSATDAIYRSFAANYSTYLTHIDWSKAVNGTLLPTATFNSNYSATDAIYRSFAANYSTFLTHVTWANVVNGTVAATNAANAFGAYNQTFDTNVLFVNSVSNRVGIGTTAPSQELTLYGQLNITNSTQGASGLIWDNGTGICIGGC
jgi:hypothetical protein